MSVRSAAQIAGALWIIQLLTAMISYGVILDPVLWGPDYLSDIAVNEYAVRLAMLLDLVCGASIVGIAVIIHPILKKFSERIANWYLGLRVIEFTIITINGILLLSLLSVSQNFVMVQSIDSSYYQILGDTLRSQRDVSQNMSIIIFCLGAFSLYYLFLKTRLIPRFISIWGLLAVALLFIQMMSLTFCGSLNMYLMMPMGLNELFLGAWLLFKGFDLSYLELESEYGLNKA